METAVLGRTGLKVSRLGAGLSEMGSLTDEATAGRLLNAALDGGITFLDTAACYGRSEEWIGRTIAHRRREYVLATKAGHLLPGCEGEEWTAATIASSIERSLKRMRTDCLALVQLHSCGVAVLERGEVIRALQDARDAGKTRFVGYSGDGAAAEYAVGTGQFDTLQLTFNLTEQAALAKPIPAARAAGMGVIAKRPIARAAWGAPETSDRVTEQCRLAVAAMLERGPIPNAPANPLLLALGFVLAHREIDTAIVGTRNPDHMRANVELVRTGLPIAQEAVEELHRRFAACSHG